MTCADVSEQLVDYLYGELGTEARSSFEAHLASCDSCRAEVASHGSTLGRVRVALAAGNEVVPVAVKEGSEKLAQMVARRGGQPFRTLGAPVIPEDAGGLWGLLRKPWFFPVFAAASVIGLFFLAQEAIVRRSMPLAPIEMETDGVAPPRPTIEPIAPPTAPAAGAAAPKSVLAPESSKADRRGREAQAELSADSAEPGSAQPAPPRKVAPPAARPRRETVDPFAAPATAGGTAGGRAGAIGGGESETPLDPWRAREVSRPASGAYRGEPPPAAAAERTSDFGNELVKPFTAEKRRKGAAASPPVSDDAVPTQYAVPPPPAAPPPPPAAASSPPPAPADELAGGPAPAAATSPATAAARARPESPEAEQRALLELGDRLLNEGRASEAAAVYRSLIARYPKHPDVPTWKQRLQKATDSNP